MRDRVVTDPRNLAHALDRCLEPRFIAGEAMKIDRHKAAPWPLGPSEATPSGWARPTRRGLVVSYIQSLYWEFGSGCVLPRTGVLMQNRGISFSLQRGALNSLAPGRLPFHTLNPALAVLKDGRVMAYGAMGGDGQPQTQGAVFTRYALFGEPLADAIDRPRWVLGRTWGDPRTALRLEPRFDDALIDALVTPAMRSKWSRALFRHHGPCRRGGAASRRHLEGAHDPRRMAEPRAWRSNAEEAYRSATILMRGRPLSYRSPLSIRSASFSVSACAVVNTGTNARQRSCARRPAANVGLRFGPSH